MNEARYLLRPDVVVEPLVAGWHATSHLLSPLSFALITARRHLPLLESFLDDPEVHEAAVQDPDLLGGPFVDLPIDRLPEARAFLHWTRTALSSQLELAGALDELWQLLAERADGHSMAELYVEMPKMLRGLVELVYTPAGAPDIRPIEALLQNSAYQDPALQCALIQRTSAAKRSFAMCTPRLPGPHDLVLERPFCDPAYDLLARARHEPVTLAGLLAGLGLDDRHADRLLPLLQEASTHSLPPRPALPPARSRWRYFGHACVLVETAAGQSILIDPVIANEPGREPDRYTLADLPERIDYLLITHNHPDHALVETLLALRWRTDTVLVPANGGSLVDPSLKLFLESLGFSKVRSLDPLEQVENAELAIRAIPFLGEHADLDIRSKTAWLVDTGDQRLLFAADSNNLAPELYRHLAPLIGRLDALFLGMECQGAPMSWLYGALLPRATDRAHDQSRRLDGSDSTRALALVEALDIGEVLVYAMGLEPWLRFICGIDDDPDNRPMTECRRFIEMCQARGVPARRLYGRDG